MSDSAPRLSTGVPGLDELLGGGLVPGTLTVIVGSTGIGKTQLGVQFAQAGLAQDGRRGVIFDMTARGDSQSHGDYARRMFDWRLTPLDVQVKVPLDDFYAPDRSYGDYLHVFDYRGQRVTRRDLEWEQWQEWQSQLNTRLQTAIAFLYGNFVQGVRRVVIDGIEPSDRPGESIQFNLFEYVYHQVLRKDPEWVARDLFRERFRVNASSAAVNLCTVGILVEFGIEAARIEILVHTSRVQPLVTDTTRHVQVELLHAEVIGTVVQHPFKLFLSQFTERVHRISNVTRTDSRFGRRHQSHFTQAGIAAPVILQFMYG